MGMSPEAGAVAATNGHRGPPPPWSKRPACGRGRWWSWGSGSPREASENASSTPDDDSTPGGESGGIPASCGGALCVQKRAVTGGRGRSRFFVISPE